MAIQERQNVTITSAGVTREGVSNTKGHFNFTETTSKNGTYHVESDLKTQDLVATDKETAVKGNDITDVGGDSSRIVSGVSEAVVGSEYTVVGTAHMYHGSYQELANKAQLKLVSTRSMPDKVPDTSLLAPLTDMMKPAPHILKNVVQPKAEDILEKVKLQTAAPGAGLGTTIYTELANYATKMSAMMGVCSMETAKELVKYQANYMKDAAKQSLKSKQKMYRKLTGPSKEVFKENFGNILFNEKGEITLETSLDALQTITDPVKLAKLFFPVTPPQDDDKKIQAYDKDKAQGEIAKTLPDVIEAERNIC